MQKIIPLLTLALCLCTSHLMATVIYVDSSNISGFQDGTTWVTAFINPQSAINISGTGDSVWLAKGTYQPIANTSFSMKEAVKVLGGFLNTYTSIGQRNWQNNITILKGSPLRLSIKNYCTQM